MTDLLDHLHHSKLDGIRNKFGVLLNNLLDLLLQVLESVLFKVKSNFNISAKRRVNGVGREESNGKKTTGGKLPDIPLIIVVFRDNLNALDDKICRVETNTELTNHGNIGARVESWYWWRHWCDIETSV